jgi:hypothetical protein
MVESWGNADGSTPCQALSEVCVSFGAVCSKIRFAPDSDQNADIAEGPSRKGRNAVVPTISRKVHQLDACGQQAHRPPDGIDNRYCAEQHKALRADTIVSSYVIKQQEEAAKNDERNENPEHRMAAGPFPMGAHDAPFLWRQIP